MGLREVSPHCSLLTVASPSAVRPLGRTGAFGTRFFTVAIATPNAVATEMMESMLGEQPPSTQPSVSKLDGSGSGKNRLSTSPV